MASMRVIPNFTISAQSTSSDTCSDDQDCRNTGTLTAFVDTCRGNGGQLHSQMEKAFSELPRERDLATPAMASTRVIPNFMISAQSTSSDTCSA